MQASDRGADCPWHMPPAALTATVDLLVPGEDEIAQVPFISGPFIAY